MKPIVIIAAHGSEATRQSNQPIHQLAHSLGQSELFSHVTGTFLNGAPLVDEVLDLLPKNIELKERPQVIVIPAMTSEGYYMNVVLPKRLAENSSLDSFDVTVTPAIGLAPELAELVTNRVRILASEYRFAPTDTTVVLVGHGTRRNPHSGDSTYALAAKTAEQIEFPVVAAFIDQDPEIEFVRSQINTPNTIVIPFLMGIGPHTTDDVPESFGLVGGPGDFPRFADTFEGRCVCARPIGVDPELVNVALRLAKEATYSESRSIQLKTNRNQQPKLAQVQL